MIDILKGNVKITDVEEIKLGAESGLSGNYWALVDNKYRYQGVVKKFNDQTWQDAIDVFEYEKSIPW